jgi:hypothetical protein
MDRKGIQIAAESERLSVIWYLIGAGLIAVAFCIFGYFTYLVEKNAPRDP